MLEKLAKHHDLWVKMLINLGCNYQTAQDLTQEMYIRMHRLVTDEKKIMYNDEEVNHIFVYVTLKNMYFDYKKAKGRYTFFEYLESDDVDYEADERFIDDQVDFDLPDGFESLTEEILKEIKTWPRYDVILASIYFKTDYSLRDIATGSGISLTSIFNSIRNYRAKLKERLGEDYEDYLNGDWHLIGKLKDNDNEN